MSNTNVSPELTVSLDEYELVNLAETTTAALTCKYSGDDKIDTVEWKVGGGGGHRYPIATS